MEFEYVNEFYITELSLELKFRFIFVFDIVIHKYYLFIKFLHYLYIIIII